MRTLESATCDTWSSNQVHHRKKQTTESWRVAAATNDRPTREASVSCQQLRTGRRSKRSIVKPNYKGTSGTRLLRPRARVFAQAGANAQDAQHQAQDQRNDIAGGHFGLSLYEGRNGASVWDAKALTPKAHNTARTTGLNRRTARIDATRSCASISMVGVETRGRAATGGQER